MRRAFGVSIGATALLLLVGCNALLHSNRVGSEKGTTLEEVSGIAYSLPKVMVRLEASYQESFITNVLHDQPVIVIQTWSTNQAYTNVAGPALLTTNAFNSLTLRSATTNLSYSVTKRTNYVVTLSEVLVPDPLHLYSLKIRPQVYAADAFGIAVSANGFLTSVNLTNEDRSGAIIKKIAETAIEVYKLASGQFVTSRNGKEERVTARAKVDLHFDPTDPNEISTVNTLLGNIGRINLVAPDTDGMAYHKVAHSAEQDGIYYRPKQAYILEFLNDDQVIRKVILLPNKAPVLSFNLKRAPFVKQTSQLALVDGFLTQVNLDKPSELEAIVTVPYDIVKSVATIPTNLIQLRIDYSSANQRLLEAQAKEIAGLTNLLSAQQRLLEIQATQAAAGATNK